MLSFNRGKEIAKVLSKDGKKTLRTIKLFGADDFSEKTESDIVIPKAEYPQLLTNDFFKSNKIPKAKQDTIRKIISGEKPREGMSLEMKEYMEIADKEVIRLLKTQVHFDVDSSNVFPIPQKKSERIYVPAPSGSGKSTFIGMYLKELRAKYKKRPIFIFSRIEEDKPLDAFKNTFRIPLTRKEFEDNPLEIENFKNGILIFDDIDTIMDKQLVKYIRGFRDDVLETGRHYDITIISTSHIITNFLATRTLINEANAIVLFPKGSSFYAVSNFLERYMGFSKAQIRMVENLKTRWIWFWKEYPKYAIYEHGAFIF
mgnify:FL=1